MMASAYKHHLRLTGPENERFPPQRSPCVTFGA
jgi:hypothetical protein